MDFTNREEEAAKARRLIRFGARVETRPKGTRLSNISDSDESPMSRSPVAAVSSMAEVGSRSLSGGHAKWRDPQVGRNETAADRSMELDVPDNLTSEAILGSCPDMCPEPEREERERKGDLDKFERLGGNRNQTARNLAVKKYTRTAEKDSVLIRPLPVLKETMFHLLSLLERGHEDDLLAVHSFLWDRMRAVRMDLRMQHIFTEDAISMHEQMIRFHILAMHELCEYSQGEGISEVFNAHLNIEQMNKASVDLFQMYDDHSKMGISVATEAEFRGYYALLKIDKHPGYRVEPAELSLDLAKMTPEMRNSPQVLFARDVARACRASNYVAFFRLVRGATYLQACLMHAHFSKLRTQALASLHSGLQKNQGIPLSTVVNWLGMEGEDIEALLKYHGFSIKYYEESFMVKEGPFLNKNQDFPTCRSQMVEAKRSLTVVLDVQSERHPDTVTPNSSNVKINGGMSRIGMLERKMGSGTDSHEDTPILASLGTVLSKEEDMPDYVEEPVEGEAEKSEAVQGVPTVVTFLAEEDGKQGKRRRMEELQFEAEEHERRRLRHEADAAARRAASQAAIERKKLEEQLRREGHKAEATYGKQGCWFRKWRRRAAAKALERYRKIQQTQAALNTLSIGYPLWRMRIIGESVSLEQRHEFINALVEEQGVTLQQMWEPLNIPSVVGPILHELYPAAGFLCWNLLLCTPHSWLKKWIRTKVSGRQKSVTGQDFADQILSGIKHAEETILSGGIEHCSIVDFWCSVYDVGSAQATLLSIVALHGASGLLFVMNEDESMLAEHDRLHSLVQGLPHGLKVPLLVVSTKLRSNQASQMKQFRDHESWEPLLKLDELSTSKISHYKIVSVANSSGSHSGKKGFLSDDALREGLTWLAKLCPAQPHLRALHVGNLVGEHVDTHLKLLREMPPSQVSAEHCVIVFSKELEIDAEDIGGRTSGFPTNWSPSGGVGIQKRSRFDGERLLSASQELDSRETPCASFLSPVTKGHSELQCRNGMAEEIVTYKHSELPTPLFEGTYQVSGRGFELALSPFEILLDKMAAEFSRKTFEGSEDYLADRPVPHQLEIEEHRMKYLELQCSSWAS